MKTARELYDLYHQLRESGELSVSKNGMKLTVYDGGEWLQGVLQLDGDAMVSIKFTERAEHDGFSVYAATAEDTDGPVQHGEGFIWKWGDSLDALQAAFPGDQSVMEAAQLLKDI